MMQFWPMGSWLGNNQALLSLIVLWSLVWKGMALWKAAGRKEQWWFIALLVINTMGILEILYIYVFSEKKGMHQHHENHEHSHN